MVEHQLPKLRRRVRFPSPASLKPRNYAVFVFSGLHLRIHGVLAGAHCLDGLCNALVPYPVILAASKGDPDAMKIVLQHFSGYIASLSMRKLYEERGNVYFGVDEEIRERLQAKLMRAILTFRAE